MNKLLASFNSANAIYLQRLHEKAVPLHIGAATQIMTRCEWQCLRAYLDAFYEETTDEALVGYEAAVNTCFQRIVSGLPVRQKTKGGANYIIQQGSLYKIGMTIDVTKRLRCINTVSGQPAILVHHFPSDDCARSEHRLHEKFASRRKRREWFALTEDDLSFLCEITSFKKSAFVFAGDTHEC